MRLIRLSLLLCLLGAFAGCDSPAVVKQVPARLLPGRVIARGAAGQGTARIEGMAEQTPLQNNLELRQGHIVSTGPDRAVTLVFSNGAAVNVAPQSEVAIETFIQLPFTGALNPEEIITEPSTSVTMLVLRHGTISGTVPKLNTDRGSSFAIRSGTEEKQFNGTDFQVSTP